MNLNTVLKKAWQILWSYRALWLFGAILALVGANTIYSPTWPDWENNGQWTMIKITDTTTIKVPGVDMTVDFTAPGGFRLVTPDSYSWSEFNNLVDLLDREASINLRPILIEATVILAVLLLLGILARYITETALIRMVDETEESGKRLSMWDGLRKGFSRRAGRLFLLDLVVGVLATIVFLVVFGLAVAPILLAIRSHEIILITAGVGTFSLLILAIYLWFAASAVLSVVLQPIRRSCVLEEQSLPSSIRQGFTLTRHHLKEVVPLWLVWVSIRLLWVPLIVPVMFLLVPFLLLAILLGVVFGGAPAALVAGIAGLYIDGVTPWIMGLLAGLPIFIVVMISPILFISGLVEIYKSSMWTLAYRDLKAMEVQVDAPSAQAQVLPAQGSAD
jgi:hypothetical protein